MLSFLKMNAAGNDFVIFDARKENIYLTPEIIKKISDRKNIGCDQLIIIKNDHNNMIDRADCFMEIYNCDGSQSNSCGNATRCVASILFSNSSNKIIKIRTNSGIVECKKNDQLISVNMGRPFYSNKNFVFNDYNFFCIDIGNPHAVCFLKNNIDNNSFYDIGPKVENNSYFPHKTNVEFAKIINNNLIEVRVWERGAGETLACGSGACAVAYAAITQGYINNNKVTTRFKGGEIHLELVDDFILMTGGYQKIFEGIIDEKFFN